MGVPFYGDYDTTESVVIPFNAFTSDDPSISVTVTNLISTDVEIYKDGSLTERNSATHSGIAVDIDVDTVVGAHWVTIDLSDNDDAGFYANGSRYQVMVVGTTIDGGTVNAWIGAFSIGCTLRPTTSGRTLDVTTNGNAGIDWNNIEAPATVVDLAGTDINLCDTVTTNSDMRGTDSAGTAAELAKVPKSDGSSSWNATALAALQGEVADALKAAGIILTTATIETVTSQTQFVIPATADATDDDAYNGGLAVFIDGTDPNQRSMRIVTDYDSATRTVTIDLAPDFTITTSDTIVLLSTTVAQTRVRLG